MSRPLKKRYAARSSFVKAGTKVWRKAHKSIPGKGLSYSAGYGVMLEEGRIGPEAGWDVYDVSMNGVEESAYGFDLIRASDVGKVKQ